MNSFWGKFGQRLDMMQSKFIHDSQADECYALLTDPLKQVKDFMILSPELLHVKYKALKHHP